MIILEKYDDGSQSILFEPGDKVKVTRANSISYTLYPYKYVPIGTEGTVIMLTVRYDKLPKHNIDPYWVNFKGYGKIKVWPWEIGG